MKKIISLILVLLLCATLACTVYATEVDDSFVSSPGASEPSEECEHSETHRVGEIGATCYAPGYTGDVVCDHCGKVIEEGEEIPMSSHHFVDGICSVCGLDGRVPQTGDNGVIFLWVAVMVLAAACLLAVAVGYRKKFANK